MKGLDVAPSWLHSRNLASQLVIRECKVIQRLQAWLLSEPVMCEALGLTSTAKLTTLNLYIHLVSFN